MTRALHTQALPGTRAGAALLLVPALVLTMLGGCAVAPPAAGPAAVPSAPGMVVKDGPPANPPPDLAQQPDPEPRVEALRSGGPNKPYEVLGERYTPLAADLPFEEAGKASWYGRKFHGRRTANGEVFDMYALSAAHRTLPLPSYALVRNPANGREIVVRINDRGPFDQRHMLDLSYAAAVKLGVERAAAPVELRRLTHDDIRTGRWRDGRSAVAAAPAGPPRAAVTTAATATTAVAIAAPVPPAAPAAPAASGATAAPAAAAATAATAAPAATAAAAATAAPMAPAAPDATSPSGAAAIALRRAEPPASPGPAQATPAVTASASASASASVAPSPAVAAGRGGFWVQFGAFGRHEGALELRRTLGGEFGWLEPLLHVQDDRRVYRVRAGPFPSRADADDIIRRVRAAMSALQPLALPAR